MEQNLFSNFRLLKHLDRLQEWMATGTTFPIVVSMHLTNLCNNKCPLCIRSEKQDSTLIDFAKAKSVLAEVREAGARGVIFAGGGDPTCHPQYPELIRYAASIGLDVGTYTNGMELSDEAIAAITDCCTWIRISMDADGPEIYKKTHGMNADGFEMVLTNVRKLVAAKKAKGSEVTIGVGYLVGKHTKSGVQNATKLARDLGVDYIRLRPFFSWDDKRHCSAGQAEEMLADLRQCLEFQREDFRVSYSANRAEWLTDPDRPRPYTKCNAHHFTTIISATLDVFPCCHLETAAFSYGNLGKQSFRDVWNSPHRKEVYDRIDLKKCPNPCMLDDHNKLLHEIGRPVTHQNFL